LPQAHLPVTENRLGLLDPTLLLNGPYQLRLQATDRLGQTTTSDPVDLLLEGQFKPGHQRLAFTDLTLPMAGIPIEIVRVYDSRAARASVHGDFGIGWTLEIRNVHLRKTRHLGRDWQQVALGGWYAFDPGRPREIIITLPDDRVLRFRAELAPALQFGYPIATVTMQFSPMPGTLGQLEIAESNLASVDGFIGPVNLIDLGTFADFNPTRFRYRSPEGDSYLIDESLGLLSVTDRLGNILRIDPDGLHHSSGLSVLFERDLQSRLTAIIDPNGQNLHYERDPIGNLIAVTDRTGHTTSFQYLHPALPHHLTAILQPGLIPVLRTEYDADGRMLRQVDPEGNSVTFHPDLAQRHEIIRNRLGHCTVYEYDERGNVIRQTDPLGAVTTSTYDPTITCWSEPIRLVTRATSRTTINSISSAKPIHSAISPATPTIPTDSSLPSPILSAIPSPTDTTRPGCSSNPSIPPVLAPCLTTIRKGS
jgi:large repetitive protein